MAVEETPMSSGDGGGGQQPPSCGESSSPHTLDEARSYIRELKERHRLQSYQLLAWRRRSKLQEREMTRLRVEREDQLRRLSSQLLLFEARLCRKQKDIGNLLAARESVILKQQRLIKELQSRLREAGLEPPAADQANLLNDSLNDSDSAVVLEDEDIHLSCPALYGNPVVRSVSDALESNSSYGCGGGKYGLLRRSSCLLRRPEILETVYSVEEDPEAAGTGAGGEGFSSSNISTSTTTATVVNKTSYTTTPSPGEEDTVQSDRFLDRKSATTTTEEESNRLVVADELQHQQQQEVWNNNCCSSSSNNSQQQQQLSPTVYNRVMSNNHRSVTKPKDVKYKRINKAKSKSLEELRGKLKNWVDKTNKITLSLDQSFA